MPRPSPLRSREGITLLVLLLVGLGLRGAFLVERRSAPDFGRPQVDAGFHDDWARTLAFGVERAGEWREAHRIDPGFSRHTYLRPPGYPFFLAAVYRLTGGSPTAAVIANQLLGLAGILLAFLVGRAAFGAWEGLWAAGMLTLHWALIYFEGELHAPALLVLLELLALLLLFRSREGGVAPAIGGGLAIGLAALVRPSALAFVPVALAWLAWVRWRRQKSVWVPLSALLLGLGAALTPSTWRNAAVSGELVPITSNLGINLHLGNRAGSDGLIQADLGEGLGDFHTCYDYPRIEATLAQKLGREVSRREVSEWFGARAREWIVGNPGAFLALTARKAAWLVGPAEVAHNKEVALEKRHSAVLRWLPWSFPLLLGMALGGWLFAGGGGGGSGAPRGRREAALLIALLATVFLLSLLPFFTAARYRVPLVPFLALLTGPLVAWRAASLRRRGVALGLGVAVFLTAFLLGPEPPPDSLRWRLDRGRAFFRSEKLAAAREEFDAALALAPGTPAAHYGLAVLEQKIGRDAAAREHYQAALRGDPDHLLANYNLGFLLQEIGDTEGAERRWRAATDADLLFSAAPYQLGLILAQQRRYRQAAESLRVARERARGRPEEGHYAATLALLLATTPAEGVRDGAQALRLAEEAVAAGGATWSALEARAAALAEEGRFEEAVRAAEAALRAASDDAAARQRISAGLARYRAGQPLRM